MSVRSTHHIGGEQPDGGPAAPFGDIRDLIEALPEHAGGTGYRTSDIFTEKHRWLRENVPDARSVFEFGALCGYFLVTALDACPKIDTVGWCDNELHTPGSNEMVWRNLAETLRARDAHDDPTVDVEEWADARVRIANDRHDIECSWWTSPRDLEITEAMRFDVVQVDGEHTYRAALIDLTLAFAMRPRAILVDDSHAIAEVKAAIEDFRGYLGLEAEWFETVNGFAVIRP